MKAWAAIDTGKPVSIVWEVFLVFRMKFPVWLSHRTAQRWTAFAKGAGWVFSPRRARTTTGPFYDLLRSLLAGDHLLRNTVL